MGVNGFSEANHELARYIEACEERIQELEDHSQRLVDRMNDDAQEALSKIRNLRVQRDALRQLTDAQAAVIAEETGSHAWTIAYARMQEAKKVAERLAPKAAPFQESMPEPEAETQPIAPKMDKITRLGK